MQLYYMHVYGNLEAISILIEADADEDNNHFQIMLDYFQKKFDSDESLCQKRQRRARALLRKRGSSTANDEEEEVEEMLIDSFNLRGWSAGRELEDALEVGDEGVDEFSGGNDERGSSSSLGRTLLHKIHDRFLSFAADNRELKELRWDPLEPWEMYRSVHFWGYSGSTTEPPCFEDVKWRVTDVPARISPRQYIQLKRLMFDHVDPDTCRRTSSHFDESNARPVQRYRGGATYRCRRRNYASDKERKAAGGIRKGFKLEANWKGVDMFPYIVPEFPNV